MDTYLIETRYYNHVSIDTVKEFEEEIEKYTNWEVHLESYKLITKFFKFAKRIPFTYNIIKKLKTNKNFFVILMSIGLTNKCFPYFYFKAENKIIYLFDSWEPFYSDIIKFINEYNINIVFFSSKKSYEYFNTNFSLIKSYWLPEGIKFDNYYFFSYDKKDIDIMQIGRKYDLYHDMIVNHCKNNNIIYLYEKIKGEIIFPNRSDFLKALARTKISICVPSNITHFERSGNISTMTQRYLQSMASKCLVLGIMPEDMKELFNYNPVVDIDLENPEDQIENILLNFDKYIPLIEKNYETIKNNHQWKDRIFEMKNLLKNIQRER